RSTSLLAIGYLRGIRKDERLGTERFRPVRNWHRTVASKGPKLDHADSGILLLCQRVQLAIRPQRPVDDFVIRRSIVWEPDRGGGSRCRPFSELLGKNRNAIAALSEENAARQPGNAGSDDRDLRQVDTFHCQDVRATWAAVIYISRQWFS